MSKKSTTLAPRPQAPSVEEIISDIEIAKETDVAFTWQNNRQTSCTVTPLVEEKSIMSESYEGDEALAEDEDGCNREEKDATNIDLVYSQAVQFIELTQKLKEAPASLRAQYEYMQKLGSDMNDSIDALKQQADSVLRH